MFQLKRIHRSLLIYLVSLYSFSLLVLHHWPPSDTTRQGVRYLDLKWDQLSSEALLLSAYYDDRPLAKAPFVRVLTIAKYKKEMLVKTFGLLCIVGIRKSQELYLG